MNQANGEGRRPRRGAEAASERPFEEQLAELDAIVAALEEGKLPLDEALTLYERGVRLAQACQRRVDDAELRVSRLRAAERADNVSDNSGNGAESFLLETIELDGD